MERIPKLVHWYHSIGFMLVMGMIMGVAVYFCGNNNVIILDHIIEEPEKVEKILLQSCDFFNGNWVYDNISRPLYSEKGCSFMTDAYACVKFGEEFKYQFWRWQPHGRDIPRFNGTALLEKLKGRKGCFCRGFLRQEPLVSLLRLIYSSLDTF